jgi:hypothetical protein
MVSIYRPNAKRRPAMPRFIIAFTAIKFRLGGMPGEVEDNPVEVLEEEFTDDTAADIFAQKHLDKLFPGEDWKHKRFRVRPCTATPKTTTPSGAGMALMLSGDRTPSVEDPTDKIRPIVGAWYNLNAVTLGRYPAAQRYEMTVTLFIRMANQPMAACREICADETQIEKSVRLVLQDLTSDTKAAAE